MKFRKKHKEQSEVFTDSLNDILFILLMFFLITTTMANPNVKKVNVPRGTKDTKAKQNIVVSIDKDQNYYLGQKKIAYGNLDTMLIAEIERVKKTVDTPTVVIHADTLSYYGGVFKIIEIAGKQKAKVVANVK
jgi:biopolymer transport protein ExbD